MGLLQAGPGARRLRESGEEIPEFPARLLLALQTLYALKAPSLGRFDQSADALELLLRVQAAESSQAWLWDPSVLSNRQQWAAALISGIITYLTLSGLLTANPTPATMVVLIVIDLSLVLALAALIAWRLTRLWTERCQPTDAATGRRKSRPPRCGGALRRSRRCRPATARRPWWRPCRTIRAARTPDRRRSQRASWRRRCPS